MCASTAHALELISARGVDTASCGGDTTPTLTWANVRAGQMIGRPICTALEVLRFTLIVLTVTTSAMAQGICPIPEPTAPPTDLVSPTRQLRRITLSLVGTTPTPAQFEAVINAGDEAARQQVFEQTIDDALASTKFYEKLLELGHDWVAVGEYTTGAIGDAYQGDMSGHLGRCGTGPHAGAYYSVGEMGAEACPDPTLESNQVEPWWAPGTTITVLGKAGTNTPTIVNKDGKTIDCGIAGGGYYDPAIPSGCGCGPNLTWCSPLVGLRDGSSLNENGQRRHPWDEPARLFAHLVWYDRPLSDLVIGNYTVANNMLRALYVRLGRQTGDKSTDGTSWWQAAADTAPSDPMHTAGDPLAWREVEFEKLNPMLLSARTTTWDPRVTKDAPQGMPAAGVLTMMGSNSSFSRERVRAARWLETFACYDFQPPPTEVQFNAYAGDPATSGTCQHCHRSIDPAAIFFKRWDFGLAYYVPWPFLPGIGPNRVTKQQLSGIYPYSGPPYTRWKDAWKPDTVLTPVTQAQIDANPEAVLLDTLPTEKTLLGTHGDGTMGPLGFGKILVASGEFDRCATRRLFEHYVGRPIDPAREAGYLGTLTKQFVDGGRKVKPFVKSLLLGDTFKRGL